MCTGSSVDQPHFTLSPPEINEKIEDEIDPEILGNIQSKQMYISSIRIGSNI